MHHASKRIFPSLLKYASKVLTLLGTYVCVSICVYMHVCMHMWVYMCVCIYVCECICVYVSVCVCLCVCVCPCVHYKNWFFPSITYILWTLGYSCLTASAFIHWTIFLVLLKDFNTHMILNFCLSCSLMLFWKISDGLGFGYSLCPQHETESCLCIFMWKWNLGKKILLQEK